MSFYYVQPDRLDEFWPICKPMLETAFRFRIHADTADDYYEPLKNSEYQLWVAVSEDRVLGAVITSIIEGSNAKICNIHSLGGDDLPEWVDEMNDTLTGFANENKCAAIEAITRRGFARFVPNWVEDGVCFVKDLRGSHE